MFALPDPKIRNLAVRLPRKAGPFLAEFISLTRDYLQIVSNMGQKLPPPRRRSWQEVSFMLRCGCVMAATFQYGGSKLRCRRLIVRDPSLLFSDVFPFSKTDSLVGIVKTSTTNVNACRTGTGHAEQTPPRRGLYADSQQHNDI